MKYRLNNFFLVFISASLGGLNSRNTASAHSTRQDTNVNEAQSQQNSTLSSNARVVNGVQASITEFPYASFIYIDEGNSGEVCTGALLSSTVLVTAAHCLLKNFTTPYNPAQITVSVGSSNYIVNNNNRYLASRLYAHPQFDADTLQNDIGLIMLSSPVPSSLATPVAIFSGKVTDGMGLVAAGWGVTSNSPTATTASVLNKVPLVVSSAAACKELNPYWISNDGPTVCTININGQDTCYGDSGGPLAYIGNNVNSLVGITSFGNVVGDQDTAPPCGVNGGAGYYTHLYYHINWISSTTGMSTTQLLGSDVDKSNTTTNTQTTTMGSAGKTTSTGKTTAAGKTTSADTIASADTTTSAATITSSGNYILLSVILNQLVSLLF
ncbi:Chymotrypsin BI [Zancudomyces culisetae]|uniref:Chymotrypsin BI n=1 Tax=Zancudomyces culisetae TaxID=1213189 RepID=A0A1R1PYC2_ZANCU|nr:Chymotrypsin BI [Zancudomyces culisetae]|eukprot:OMH85966.1 Chymotrypsin BI [Zancudomyces culisetae]